MTKRMALVLLASTVLGAPALGAGEDFKSVEKKLTAAWAKQRSMTAKLTIVADTKGEQMSFKTSSQGTFEYLKQGETNLLRMEQKTHSVTKGGGLEMKEDQTMSIICDGEHTYTVTEADGEVFAFKLKMKTMGYNPADTVAQFKMMQEITDMKLLPSQKIDGKKVYVIEGTPNKKMKEMLKGAPMMPGKRLLYYREDGVPVKMVWQTADGKPMHTMTYSDVKINVKIDPKRFVFKAPPGVEVKDTSQMALPGGMGGVGGAPAARPSF